MDPQAPAPTPTNPEPTPVNPTPTPVVESAPVAPAAPAGAPPAAAPEAAFLPNVPETWPGAWGLYKYSKQAVRRNWKVILGLFVLAYVVPVILEIALKQLGRILGDVVTIVTYVAIINALFASVRGQKISLGGAFSISPLTFLKVIVNYVFLGITIAFSIFVFIIPFFIIFPRVILAPYLVIGRNLGPFEAINASWAMTKGNSGKVWGVLGAAIAMALLMITIIGIPFALYFLFTYSAAFMLLCEYLAAKQTVAAPAAPAQPVAPTVAPQAPVTQ